MTLRLQHTIDHKVLSRDDFDCLTRLADLVGANFPYKNYEQYLAHEARYQVKKEEYRRKIKEAKNKVSP